MQGNGHNPAIAIEGLRKAFGKQVVLNGVDLQVQRSETVVVLGRSGTGKSVLLKLIIGLQQPDAGSIRIGGQDVPGLQGEQLKEIRKKIGFMFQHAALYDSMSLAANVKFPMERHMNGAGGDIEKRARDLLFSVGMKEEDLVKLPSQISGGMQKRVALARALALEPELLLFDEPTAGLDPITAAEIGELIVRMKKERGISSVVVTHDIAGARIFADRMVLMHEGSIRLEGSYEDLRRSEDDFVTRFLGACDVR